MATRAQLSQERSRQRRDELLAAAIELFAEGGSRSITHRAVAARAGLPPATTTYYFESIHDLIHEALSSHLAQWQDTLDALSGSELDVRGKIDQAPGFIRSVFAARGPDVAALELSIYLAAARDERLREQAAEAMRSLERLASRLLAGVGVQEPQRLAAACVALVNGTALRRQSGLYSEEDEADQLAATIRSLVAAHLLGDAAVTEAVSKLPSGDA